MKRVLINFTSSYYFQIIKLVLFFAILGMLYWGWQLLKQPQMLPIKTVKIYATYQHVSKDQYQTLIAPLVSTGFFALSVSDLRKKLIAVPWIAAVSVHRIWPDTIALEIDEQAVAARWGQDALLNQEGQVFKPAQIGQLPAGLPWMNGPADQAQQIWQQYRRWSVSLQPLQIKILQLVLNARGSWSLLLSNGLQVIVGEQDAAAHWQRFVAVYPKVFAGHVLRNVVADLRYTNGMSVDWHH